MAKLVMHKLVYRPGPFGVPTNMALCGRLRSGLEMNFDSQDGRVTCKGCLKTLNDLREQVRRLSEPISDEEWLTRLKLHALLTEHGKENDAE